MRKHIAAALAVILAVFMSALPLTAYASDTASMEVTLTLTEDDVTPPEDTATPGEPEPSGPDFVVHIPASMTLSEDTDGMYTYGVGEIVLTWTNYSLVDNDTVDVYIDVARTFPDGIFWLKTGDGNTDERKISCFITYSDVDDSFLYGVNGQTDSLVAKFSASHLSEHPISGGKLYFKTMAGPFYWNEPGTYAGTVYFKMEVNSNP